MCTIHYGTFNKKTRKRIGMIKASRKPQGHIVYLKYSSKILKNNPLHDPHARKIGIYLPAEYEMHPKKRYPLFMYLAGFTGSGLDALNWRNFTENLPERLDRLMYEKKMGPVIVIFPDCFTRLGGNQYINSTAIGNYEDYLIDEIIPCVENQFRTFNHRDKRACFGHSSGGYGSLMYGMKRPDVWGAIACHAGDMHFDLCYRTDFPAVCTTLGKYNGSIQNFLKTFEKASRPSREDIELLMTIAMAASYDADKNTPLGFHWPVDYFTAEIDEKRWKHWKAHDPLHIVEKYVDNLRKLNLLYLDVGNRDEYRMHFGARLLVNKLKRLKIKHFYEEFNDGHSGTAYRFDISLPMLYSALIKS